MSNGPRTKAKRRDADVTTKQHIERIGETIDALVRWSRVSFYERIFELSGTSLDRSGIVILNGLYLNGPQRLSDMADYLRLDRSTVSRQVKSLVDAGLVGKERVAGDSRTRLLHMTDEGHEAVVKVRQSWLDVIEELLEDLDERELGGLAEFLPALGTSVERHIR